MLQSSCLLPSAHSIKYLTILTFAILLGSSSASSQQINDIVCVRAPRANLRAGPGPQHRINWQINRHMPLKLLAQQGSWLKVEDLNQEIHWIAVRLVSNKFPCIAIAKPSAQIRQGPSSRAPLLFVIEKNTPFRVIKQQENWLQLDYYQQDIWVHDTLVWPQPKQNQ